MHPTLVAAVVPPDGPQEPTLCTPNAKQGGWLMDGACECMDPATVYTNCSTCLFASHGYTYSCSNGWCESTSQCLAGNGNGPTIPAECGQWLTPGSGCPGA